MPGDLRLTAYVVPDGARPESPRTAGDALRSQIKERLPEYMVPSAVIWVAALPLTPSGKVDRQALPAPTVDAERSLEAPQTAVERALADIWRDVIGCAEVGRDDDFFDLGGHSLTAMKLTARVWRDLGVEVSLDVVFDRPVLSDMAAYIATFVPDASPAGSV
jgi:aryl carrier-like protein